jgi:hypothetical protein
MPEFSAAEAEQAIRRLLADQGLRAPDEILPRASGGITCLWHDEKVALIITDEEAPDASGPRPVSPRARGSPRGPSPR